MSCIASKHLDSALTLPVVVAPFSLQLVDVDAEALVYMCQGLADESDQPLGSSIQDSYSDEYGFDDGPKNPGKQRSNRKQKGKDKINPAANQQDGGVTDGLSADERIGAFAAAAGSTFAGATTATATSGGPAAAAANILVSAVTVRPTDADSVVPLQPEAVFALSSRPSAVKKVRPAEQQQHQRLPHRTGIAA
jgi:hypothetical protein